MIPQAKVEALRNKYAKASEESFHYENGPFDDVIEQLDILLAEPQPDLDVLAKQLTDIGYEYSRREHRFMFAQMKDALTAAFNPKET
jgi:hypothetical protein